MEKYYPPTPSNLTQANADLNRLVHTRDIGGFYSFENDLANASRRYEAENPRDPYQPYLDIIVRASQLRHEVAEINNFEINH
jgi:hypothetical protein